MSGHSKWATIKRDKGAKDAKRGALFSKLSKKITLAAKAGGSPDPKLNFQLAREVEIAKREGLPLDNVDRAIKKAFGADGSSITEVTYEGYGPAGTAFLVECATDSTNRTVSEIKHIFTKAGGSLGAMGSVAWQFETKGEILIERDNNLENYELIAIDAGASDVEESQDGLVVYTPAELLETIKNTLVDVGAKIASAEIVKTATQKITVDNEQREKVEKLIETLENYEDTIAVYTNANI